MSRFNVTTDVLYNKNIKKDVKIIHLSDIHFSVTTKKLQLDNLVRYIEKEKPNYIAITGDLIDTPSITKDDKIEMLISFLKQLSKLAMVLISIGNHDVISNKDYEFFNKLNKINHNIRVLNDDNCLLDNIFFIGATLPSNYYYNVTGDESALVLEQYINEVHHNFDYIPKNVMTVLLVHSPLELTDKLVINKLAKIDLILCGHTHAGMVPKWMNCLFPKNRGIVSPTKRIFPKIAKGKIEKMVDNKKITIIINGAFTKLSYQAGIIFNKFNFLYRGCINKIIIKKEGK